MRLPTQKVWITMDVNIITQLIGSIGFPIVAFIMMYWLFKEYLEKLIDAITRLDTSISNQTVLMELLEKKLKEEKENDSE